MTNYVYCDKVGSGPLRSGRHWGLFSTKLTELEAQERYQLNARHREKWFGIVRLDADGNPDCYLQMCPGANGVVLERINDQNSVEASYSWRAYFEPKKEAELYTGADRKLFLNQILWYSYPQDRKHFSRSQSTGHVEMQFREDGYAREEVVSRGGLGDPDAVETREFQAVDVSANWLDIPEFGSWDQFFIPENLHS